MTHARTVLPTDLVALVSYDGRVYSNQAMTRDRVGTQDSPHPLETAFEQWFSFATGRHTCVSVKGPTLRGLVSARKRGSKQAWEIDCLIDAAEDDTAVLMSLLDQIVAATGRSGAMKLFLRVETGSTIETAAARSGFMPYTRERLYRRAVAAADSHTIPADMRRGGKADLYPLFQLYNAAVPASIRRVEGMTLGEWTASQESLGRTTQYVLERQGVITGWLRVAGDGDAGRFDLLGRHEALDDLIDAGMAKIANRDWTYVLVGDHQTAAGSRLAVCGFEATEEYTVMSRRTVHPVKQAMKVPAVVQTTFG